MTGGGKRKLLNIPKLLALGEAGGTRRRGLGRREGNTDFKVARLLSKSPGQYRLISLYKSRRSFKDISGKQVLT